MTNKTKLSFMKNIILLFCLALSLSFVGCDNPEKARDAMDEGINQMYNYGNNTKAEACFTEALQYEKNNYEAYYYRGCTKFNRGKYKEAVADFEKVLELKPNHPDAYFALGRISFISSDVDMACYYYKLADQYGRPNMEDFLKICH